MFVLHFSRDSGPFPSRRELRLKPCTGCADTRDMLAVLVIAVAGLLLSCAVMVSLAVALRTLRTQYDSLIAEQAAKREDEN